MKTLYIDCAMGCAGDMLTAALLELHPDKAAFLNKMNKNNSSNLICKLFLLCCSYPTICTCNRIYGSRRSILIVNKRKN